MSASGVDKSNLREIGRDVLLVQGLRPARDSIVLSIPPDVKPNRVSVDAIEHWMIYREHPEVGAILHVHAWIEGTSATEINYPCGTLELADLGRRPRARSRPTRHRAVVGQTQPRPHHHRPQPRRDLRPHRRQDRPRRPHGLTT